MAASRGVVGSGCEANPGWIRSYARGNSQPGGPIGNTTGLQAESCRGVCRRTAPALEPCCAVTIPKCERSQRFQESIDSHREGSREAPPNAGGSHGIGMRRGQLVASTPGRGIDTKELRLQRTAAPWPPRKTDMPKNCSPTIVQQRPRWPEGNAVRPERTTPLQHLHMVAHAYCGARTSAHRPRGHRGQDDAHHTQAEVGSDAPQRPQLLQELVGSPMPPSLGKPLCNTQHVGSAPASQCCDDSGGAAFPKGRPGARPV